MAKIKFILIVIVAVFAALFIVGVPVLVCRYDSDHRTSRFETVSVDGEIVDIGESYNQWTVVAGKHRFTYLGYKIPVGIRVHVNYLFEVHEGPVFRPYRRLVMWTVSVPEGS